MQRFLLIQILALEIVHDLLRRNLALLLGYLLDNICKLFVHRLWQLEAKISIHNESDTALAGLGIDTHDGLVLPSDIGRIDRQIRNLPDFALSLLHCLHALVDRILMGTGECGKYQLAGIRMSRMDRDLAASFVNTDNIVDMSDFQLRVDALGEHVVGDI